MKVRMEVRMEKLGQNCEIFVVQTNIDEDSISETFTKLNYFLED